MLIKASAFKVDKNRSIELFWQGLAHVFLGQSLSTAQTFSIICVFKLAFDSVHAITKLKETFAFLSFYDFCWKLFSKFFHSMSKKTLVSVFAASCFPVPTNFCFYFGFWLRAESKNIFVWLKAEDVLEVSWIFFF